MKLEPIRITAEATPNDVVRYLDILLAAVPATVWQKRVAHLIGEGEAVGDPLLFADDYELEFAMIDLLKHRAAYGQLPSPPRSATEYGLLSFVAGFSQVYSHLSDSGRNRLASSFRSFLKDKNGLRPLAFELSTVVHLSRRGFAVAFHDLEEGGFDFIVTKQDQEAEIECKSFGRDIGRQIHRPDLMTLAKMLHGLLEQSLLSHPNTHIAVRVPKRLASSEVEQRAIKQCVEAALASESGAAACDTCKVEIRQIDPKNPAIAAMLQAKDASQQRAVADALGLEKPHVIFHVHLGIALVALSVTSMRRDKVVRSMIERVKNDVARQFSGNRAAIICVELRDVTGDELAELAQAQGALQALLYQVFVDRSQLDAFIFVSRELRAVAHAAPHSAEYRNVSYVNRRIGIDVATNSLISEMFGTPPQHGTA